MNDKNDAAFQAGEPNREDPIPVIVPIGMAREEEVEPPTWLDHAALVLKPYERLGIGVGVALQAGVLIAMMVMGGIGKFQ